ncbi:PREDICTED: DNA-directed RNA polymerase, mitochondrial isoform X2 [Polistes canadensis]|uniref:DNA-directed RNA polymerase, mitochondrial isoform X2 n=1 Tax=Polistes canadensis TaxID=91411 RepID=UPI000718F101|nr:PREDICTED: DNA-directed RNA polymerase, mitochondrial isoform X2 [Polistes canadensis]
MYRFLKTTQCISFQNIYLLPTQSSINRLPLCSFCKVQHRNAPSTIWFINKCYFRTTINDAEVRINVKKKSRIRRKYAELLEGTVVFIYNHLLFIYENYFILLIYYILILVTDQVTSNKKAAVKKLNAGHLSFLVNQPDLTLDKLHKINNNHLHEKHNKRNLNTSSTTDIKNDIAIIEDQINFSTDIDPYDLDTNSNEKSTIYEDFKESNVYDHGSFIKSSHISNTFNTEEFIEKIENDNKSASNICKDKIKDRSSEDKFNIKKMLKKNKTKNIKKIIKNSCPKKHTENSSTDIISQMILAQIDVCLSCKILERVPKLLKYFMKKVDHESPTAIRNACNLILDYYSSDGNVMKVLNVYDLMINNSITPDPQTYAAVFELIGKMTNNNHKADLFHKMQSNMVNNGISFDDIFNKSKFKLNQSENILKTIQLFKPDYQPEYIKPQMSYNCNLLKDIDKLNSRKNPAEGVLSLEQLRNSLKMQIEQENKYLLSIKSVENFHSVDNNKLLHYKEKLSDLESSWKEIALKAFERNLKYLEQQELDLKPHKFALYPFLKILPKEQYVDLILQEIRNLSQNSQSYSLTVTLLSVKLGHLVFREYEIFMKEKNGILDKSIDVYNKYLNWYSQTDFSDTKDAVNGRTVWNKLIYENQHHGPSIDKECVEWPYHVLLNIGKFLYKIIINDIKINGDNQSINSLTRQKPAFYTVFRNKGKCLVEQVKPHPILCKLYKDAQSNILTFEATLIPSLCPPRPWISINSGGYALLKTNFVRTPFYAKARQIQLLENIPSSQLYPAFDNLNQLSSIPWKVNTQVLDIVIKVFQEGGSIKLDVPQPPSILSSTDDLIENEDLKDVCTSKTRLQLKKKKEEMYSLWCDCLYKLSLANHFRNRIFWLPHNLDFRGRVYPVAPHLTHLGSDLARSILIFAQGKPLGPNGLDWLKIHTVNLTGLKKRENLKERLKFANENIDKIIDSAENPLTGDMWWAESDEPWQTLASCMEIVKALKSPNAEKYISSFPVHQDGSCNGLQHYAALGRDQIGAASVNLQPSDKPQDVYSVVVNMVEKIRSKDAEDGVQIAKILEGYLTRKIIKQTVMTTVYGVTKYGARLQIMKQMKDLENFPMEHCWEASTYLTYKTFDSLRTMFESARTIQDWFTNCAYIISTIFDEPIEWKTPLGFQVLQPYVKFKSNNQNLPVLKIDTLKQRNSFPPNFIHSLDSSHMMLTSLFCERAGITFMSVHDCFWTHPCTIDIMNKICREQFVALHSEPILDDLSKYIYEKYLRDSDTLLKTFTTKEIEYLTHTFNSVPEKGSFNLNNVLKSVYFFS